MPEQRIIADRYRLVAPLGRGGHADVYEAVHVASGMAVAVKLLRPARHDDPQIIQRFEREARALQRLRHPNTVRVLDSGQLADGERFMVLELVDGTPLARLVADRGPLSVARAIHVARQILGSAGEAHAEGLVHRDLKPENVLVSDHLGAADHVKVVDFGVAHDLDAQSLTSGTALIGTPAWMAPEQWLSQDVDPRTDLYAVGALVFFMLTGEPPFSASGSTPAATSQAFMNAHLQTPAPRLETRVPCPPELADLVAQLLAKRPSDRPADVKAALAALDRVAPTAPPPRARPWPMVVALGTTAALAFVIGRFLVPTPEPAPDRALASAPALAPVPVLVRPTPDTIEPEDVVAAPSVIPDSEAAATEVVSIEEPRETTTRHTTRPGRELPTLRTP